jgi:aldehyde:ferredoxin oxidoreductase
MVPAGRDKGDGDLSGPFGWVGRILRIDLTSERIWSEDTGRYSRDYIGGVGIVARILWNEVPPGVRPFDPENKLIFMTGPLTGTAAPSSSRVIIGSKSPSLHPIEHSTRSSVGGDWGPELKYAGYDGLVIEGRAERPVYVSILDGEAEIRSASGLWGLGAFAAQREIARQLGRDVETLCIGPAGENLSRIATIQTQTGRASGHSGFGGVMGSKNLKAIAVWGTGGVGVADPEGFLEACEYARSIMVPHPMGGGAGGLGWTRALPDGRLLRFFSKHRRRYFSCHSCPAACDGFCSVPGVGSGSEKCDGWFYRDYAYDYYGDGSEEGDGAFFYATLAANDLGVDCFELVSMIPWLARMRDRGLIDDGGIGLPLGRIGSREFAEALLRAIALKEGPGRILSEGSARAAEALGVGARELYEALWFAYGQNQHDDVRSYPIVALLWAFDSRDPMIDTHAIRHLVVTRLLWPEPFGLKERERDAICERIFGSADVADHSTYRGKARAAVICQHYSRAFSTLALCDWTVPIFSSPSARDHMGDPTVMNRLLSAATGLEYGLGDLLLIGERIYNLERAQLVREGRRRGSDALYEYWFSNPDPSGKVIPREEFERAKDEFYAIRGWDPETGIPRPEKLRELGLGDVADEMEKYLRDPGRAPA